MTAIAPVLVKAFPADAPADFGAKPKTLHFNHRLTAEDLEKFTDRYEDRGPLIPISYKLAMAGFVLWLTAGVAAVIAFVVIASMPAIKHAETPSEGFWSSSLSLFGAAGLIALTTGIGLGLYATGSARPAAKAWQSALKGAWEKQGSLLIAIEAVPEPVRDEVRRLLARLEKVRKGLNRLEPAGDELDYAREAMSVFIEASSRLPENGARMVAATHITDPAVRRAAEAYEFAVDIQGSTREELLSAIAKAEALLAERRQAKSDADLISLANA